MSDFVNNTLHISYYGHMPVVMIGITVYPLVEDSTTLVRMKLTNPIVKNLMKYPSVQIDSELYATDIVHWSVYFDGTPVNMNDCPTAATGIFVRDEETHQFVYVKHV